MNQGNIEIKDRRSGFERRQRNEHVHVDNRVTVRRRNDSIQERTGGGLSLKQEIGVIDEATIDTPLSVEEQEQLRKLNERLVFQRQTTKSGTERHEQAVKNGDELAFHQMPQGGYPLSQKNLHS